MPDISVSFSAYCAWCGSGMCGNVEVEYNSKETKITIEPCGRCIEDAKEEGHEEGVASVET